MEERSISEELRVNFLKDLDGLFCNQNGSTCVWIDNSLIIVDNKQPTDNKKTSSVIEVTLSVFFYINDSNSIVATCIK